MKNNEFLSTGEAAKALGISRSTVSRRFDEGSLRGKAHPITGERLISVESIERFLKDHVRPVEMNPLIARQIVLRSEERDLIGLVESCVAADRRIKMDIVARGSESLIICARKPTDLLILDDTSTDIACPDIIRSLRRLNDQNKFSVLCCLRASHPQKVAHWGADSVLPMAEMQLDTLQTSLYELLRLSPRDHENQATPVEHKRQWPRHALNVPGTINVYRIRTPEERTMGNVIVDNISLGGAGLSKVTLDSKFFPAESFRMLLKVDSPQLPNWQASCQVVRLKVNGEVTAGVQFVELSREGRDKILAFESARVPQSSMSHPSISVQASRCPAGSDLASTP
jgi:hypothetical protein